MEPIHWLTCVFCPSSCCNTKQCSVPKKRLLNVFWSGCQGFASSQKQENRRQETLGRIFAIQITAQNFEYVPLGLVRGYPGKIWKHYTAEKPKKYKQNLETYKILVFPINAEYFHYDPLWLVGGYPGNLHCPVIKSTNDPNSDTGARQPDLLKKYQRGKHNLQIILSDYFTTSFIWF